MDDFDVGHEQNPPAARADRGAEVDILGVHEIALVEAADRLRVGAPHQQAGAADPVRVLPPTRAAPPPRRCAPVASAGTRSAGRSCARTTAPRGRGRRPAAVRRRRRPASRSSSAIRRSIAPAGTIVSLLSSRIVAPVLARMPTLFARAKPRFVAGLDHPHVRPARAPPRRCRRSIRCRRRRFRAARQAVRRAATPGSARDRPAR